MSRRSSLSGNLSRVLAGDLGRQFVGTVRGLVIPLLVTPAAYGLWRLVLLIWQYGLYLHLGTFALLNREMPGLLATRNHTRVAEMRQIAFWGTMFVSGVAALGLAILSFTSVLGLEAADLWAIRIAAFGIVLQQIYLYLMVQFRVRSEFGSMSLLGFTQACATLALMLPLGHLAGVPGLAAGMASASLVGIAAFGRPRHFETAALRLREFGRQALAGAPLSSLPLLNATITSAGQVVSAGVLGLEEAGLLGLGIMIGTIVYAVPRAIGMVVYPRYLESYAKAENASETRLLLRRSLRVTSVVAGLAACAAGILIEPLYTHVFPRYAAALSATYALVAMMPFTSYALVLQNALLAMRRHYQVIALQCGAVTLSAGLSLLGAHSLGNVLGVALGVMIANIFSGGGTLWLGLASTKESAGSTVAEWIAEVRIVLGLGAITAGLVYTGQALGAGLPELLVPALQLLALAPIGGWLLLRTWGEARPS